MPLAFTIRYYACTRRFEVVMIHDLITAFLVAFAAVTASALLTRIWDTF
jgi:hypothetical protein